MRISCTHAAGWNARMFSVGSIASLLLLFICLFVSPARGDAQKTRKNALGIYSSVFNGGDYYHDNLIGTNSHCNTQGNFLLGVEYTRQPRRWFSWSGGIEYSTRRMVETLTGASPWSASVVATHSGDANVLSIPLQARIGFLRYLFFSLGATVDFDLKPNDVIVSQSGIGLRSGLGLRYNLKTPLTLFIEPFAQAHRIVKYRKEEGKLLNAGLRFGVARRF